ncbi:PHP domain-containing protein [Streptomyces sp. MA25(2023)]|uniref:PHP domain-containing protein n=1 Tax=Streptomyces TaxID=1883 RepID=UPI0025B15462|nr:PHP domain-containing protein [Streptomyces sp. MA25(2023)]MDN3254836.1 PHP domain-containing protein [Streptomyces sp. MA25(2023)]
MTGGGGGPGPGGAALSVDHHTHTSFSDGRDSLREVVSAAEARGLRALYVTDHVRRDTDWLPSYTAAVREAADRAGRLTVVCGVETKMLDTAGRLDVPDDLTGVTHLAIADHRFPLPDGPSLPEEVAEMLADGRLTSEAALDALTAATTAALHSVPAGRTAHLAHLFSVLPKSGLDEAAMGRARLTRIAEACRATGSAVEVNEKWRCPSPGTVRVLRGLGVRMVAGSDAHTAAAVGAWAYVAEVLGDGSGEGGESGEGYEREDGHR